jgi:hypothetical protein
VSATTATIVDSTIDGNETGTSALGAALRSWRSTVTVTNTTISGNLTPSTWGSTVLHEASSVPDPGWGVHLVASTVVGADAHLLDGPAVTVRGSALLATGGEVCDDAPTSEGANVASDASCGLVASGDVEGADLALGLLADHGGPTQTHLPDPTSPLVDAVAVGTAGLCDGTVGADQRGVPRPQGLACDVGAVERSVDD